MNIITKTPSYDGVFNKQISFEKNLATDFEHCCSADRAFSFHCRFAVFHGDFNCFWIFSFGSAFDTIHVCHIFISPAFYLPIFQYNNNSVVIATAASAKVLARSWRIAVISLRTVTGVEVDFDKLFRSTPESLYTGVTDALRLSPEDFCGT